MDPTRRAVLGLPTAALTAVLATVLSLAPLVAPVATAAPGRKGDVRLGGVRVDLRPGTRQVLTVNHTRGHHARVVLWVRTRSGWHARLRAQDGRIGYGGLGAPTRRRQGTGTTPLGTYRLPSVFGTHRRAGDWDLPYRRIRPGDFWVEDNASRYYNRYRNQRQGGFRWRLPAGAENGSERLSDYPQQYEWSVVTSFNSHQVRHRGAGIFVHVNGSGATAGCVSAPRWFVRALVRRLDPERVPVVAIGR